MRILGAVLAGGQSRRFGSDKAAALLNGEPLIDHAVRSLTEIADAVVVCGPERLGHETIADRPGPNLGPLGGLNAALHHAREHGFTRVITTGCDTPMLPAEIRQALRESLPPAIVEGMPIVGAWPADMAPMLDAYLASEENSLAMFAFAGFAGASIIARSCAIPNINCADDLKQFERER